ncbi:MAG TPA: hypothetical protein VF712_13885 [Thermoleophilaceae bacterium]|jgi:hypothetical protein
MPGAYATLISPGTTAIIALPPPRGSGAITFGRVFVSFASDFGGAVARLAIGSPTAGWRLTENAAVPDGRGVVFEALNTDQIVSVVHQSGQPVSVLVEWE